MKLYSMSDIHGCIDSFEESLSMIKDQLKEKDTKLILLGDYIHGPNSCAVLDRVMELQREYELATQRAESEFSMDPENPQKLCNAIQQMQCYIDSGMINMNTVPVYRLRLEQLLNLQMKILPDDMQARIAAVDNYLALNNFAEARILSDELIRSWPNKEQSWLTRIKVCSVMRDGDELQKTLRAIHYRGVYLSPEGKRIVQFWQNTQREGVGVL
jgi:serine/threonine protein phosphatase 1